MQRTEKQDIYTRITNQIVSHLEKGVRPWVRPWNTEHAAGRITRPLRHNGKPYSGINVLALWASAMAQNFAAPIWMTLKQTSELDAHIRKGEKGSLVVYADSIKRKETDEKTGDEIDREIPFLKGYTVFNVEQIEGLPEVYYAKAAPTLDPVARIDHAEKFFAALGATIRHSGNLWFHSSAADAVRCRRSRVSKTRIATMRPLPMNVPIGQAARPGSTVTLAGIASGAKVALVDRTLAAIAVTARKANTASALVIVSSLAEGSDRIVAAAGLAVGFALQAVLPFEKAEYERDFETPMSRSEFEELLGHACDVFELDGAADERPRAYEAAGLFNAGKYRRLGRDLGRRGGGRHRRHRADGRARHRRWYRRGVDRAEPSERNANIVARLGRSAGRRDGGFEKHLSPGRCANHSARGRRHYHLADAMIIRNGSCRPPSRRS